MRILAIEPYYGGSHRDFLDGWSSRSRHHWTLLTLPAHHWKWRMRHAATTLRTEAQQRGEHSEPWDLLWCSDMLSLADFKGLSHPAIARLPVIAYFAAGQPMSFDVPALGNFGFRGGFTVTPEFVALLLALSLYTAAFIAEIVRAGILSVHKGQMEAGASLGLSRGATLRLIVVPQAMRVIVPPLTNQYLNLTKNSSLAVAIGYPDLVSVFAGTSLSQTGQAIEIIAMTMGIYLLISLVTSAIMSVYGWRVGRSLGA